MLNFPTLLKFPLGGAQEELKRISRMFSGAFRKPFISAFASGDAVGAVIYFQDSFTGATSTELNARAPDIGANWACSANSYWRINSNQADNFGGTARPLVSDCGVSDGTITVTTDDGWSYIVARYTDDNNYWRCGAFGENALGVPLKLYEYNAGSATERGSANNYMDAPMSRKAMLNGSTIEVWQNGAARITYASATFNQSATKHGINSLQGGRLFDNILMVP